MCGGGCILWFSRAQKCVTLPTPQAGYADALEEVSFLRQVGRFMLPEVGTPCIPAFEDNRGALQVALNADTNSNSKHIDVRHHFIRELVDRREISVMFTSSEYQHAEFLIKALIDPGIV